MPHSSAIRYAARQKAGLGAVLALILMFAVHPMHAQSSTPKDQGFMRHLTFRGSGGLTSSVGGTGGIMSEGWNVGLGAGFLLNEKIGVLLDWQFSRTGIGNNLLHYNLFPSGTYHIWTASANPIYNYWHHGKFGSYVLGGGGFSRVQTIYTEPGTGPQCYLLCTCYNNCSSATGPNTVVYHYSSNQPMADLGVGFTMQIWPNHRYKLYTEARYEDLFENSNLAPYKNVEIIPLSAGISW
ncbi:MAG: hypothetical protein ACYDC6_02010 [Acidobacteriaceae bacterium]